MKQDFIYNSQTEILIAQITVCQRVDEAMGPMSHVPPMFIFHRVHFLGKFLKLLFKHSKFILQHLFQACIYYGAEGEINMLFKIENNLQRYCSHPTEMEWTWYSAIHNLVQISKPMIFFLFNWHVIET